MCHVNMHTSKTYFENRALSTLQDVCIQQSPPVGKNKILDDKGNCLNFHVLLCKSVFPFHCVFYVAHCHGRGMVHDCGLSEYTNMVSWTLPLAFSSPGVSSYYV
ncbi:unnamed protein product [Urochloa humidicola]